MGTPVIVRSHWGQHGDGCYGCKLQSLTFDRGQPKTHVKNGDPWKDNPVAERIEELRRASLQEGKKVNVAVIEKGPAAESTTQVERH